MKYRLLLLIFMMLFITGCSTELESRANELSQSLTVAQAKIKELEEENKSLITKIDELENGAGRLLQQAEQAFQNKDTTKLESAVSKLNEIHNGSEEHGTAETLLQELRLTVAKEEEEKRKAEEEALLAEKKRREAAVANLRKNYDEVREMAFYHDNSTTEYVDDNAVYLYIGKSDNPDRSWLKFRLQYAGQNWVFVESYIIKTDNNSYTLTASYNEVVRDNDYGVVWEYYDSDVNDDTIKMIRDIINSNKTIIRHQGSDKHYDHTVSEQEKKALQNILDAFDIISE